MSDRGSRKIPDGVSYLLVPSDFFESSGIFRYLRVSADIRQHLQISSGIFWHLLASAGILRYLQASSDICRHLQISAGIFRYLRASSGICRLLHISAGILRYPPVSSDICRCGPPLNKIMTRHMEYTESLQAPPGPHEAGRLLQSLA